MTIGYISTHEMKNTERGCKNGTQKRRGSRRPEALYPDCKTGKEYQRTAEGIAGRYPAVSDTNQKKEVT